MLMGGMPSPPPIMPPSRQPVPDDQAAKEAQRQAQVDAMGMAGRASTNLSNERADGSKLGSAYTGTFLGGAST